MDAEPSKVHAAALGRLTCKPLFQVPELILLNAQLFMKLLPDVAARSHHLFRIVIEDGEEPRSLMMERLIGDCPTNAVEPLRSAQARQSDQAGVPGGGVHPRWSRGSGQKVWE